MNMGTTIEPPLLEIPIFTPDGVTTITHDDATVAHFFVPVRLVWPEFANFIEGYDDAS